jgi:uncharacterized RmlC-like cupin family protein
VSSARCRLIRSGEAYEGQQGLTYLAGLTGSSAGARAISMVMVTLPPGARAKTHHHEGIETAVYVIEGEAEMWWGDRLEEHLVSMSGDYVFIPAGVPHLVMNRSAAICRAVVAHSAPDDQAGIVLHPELDAIR